MSTPTRLANKTIWALEDVLALCHQARSTWLVAMDRAEGRIDPVMMALLARLRDDLSEIQRVAQDARAGKYNEGQLIVKGDDGRS